MVFGLLTIPRSVMSVGDWRGPGFPVRAWSGVGVALLRTAVMAATVAVVVRFMPAADSWWQTVTNLLAGVGAGVLVFGAGAWALRMPELRWALGRR